MLNAAELNLGLKKGQNLGLCCDVIIDFMRRLIGLSIFYFKLMRSALL